MAQKSGTTKVAIGAGILGIAAAGIAGAYFLYGKDGAKNRKKIQAWGLKAKGEVLEKLEKAKELTEANYHEIIDTVSAKYAKGKNITPEDIASFAKDLKKHWKDIKSELAPKPPKKKAK
jgi:basic membrane lipoprotein Med (substrate-binding protein (PBP1-ABC) superfamily)